MTHSLDDTLVERLRHRAVARLSLKRPTKTDRYDAELDNSAADRIAALEAAGVAELRDALFELSIRCAKLTIATDGMKTIHSERQAACDALVAAEAALNPRQNEEEGE